MPNDEQFAGTWSSGLCGLCRKTERLGVRVVHITTVPQSLAFLQGHIGYALNRGMNIRAISSPGGQLDAVAELERIPVYGVEMPRRISIREDLAAIWRLVRVIREVRPTIVHSHTPKGGLLGTISSWITRTPIRIYHIRGLPYMTATGFHRRLLMGTERISCRLAHRVFCVSHSIRDVAVADEICPAEKIVVFGSGSGNGVDAEGVFNPDHYSETDIADLRTQWRIPRDANVILFVGRIVRDKGVEELVAAWTRIRNEHPTAWLVVAGPREPQDPVAPDALAVLESDNRVLLTGSVGETSRLYAMADMVVLPTHREGFPNVLLEGAAMALPVVATDIPGCRDAVVNGVTGTLVPVGNALSLATAIDAYLEHEQSMKEHGTAGRNRVLRDFRPEDNWSEMYAEYLKLLAMRNLQLPSS